MLIFGMVGTDGQLDTIWKHTGGKLQAHLSGVILIKSASSHAWEGLSCIDKLK